MIRPVSAAESISPAFTRTKIVLFSPFRFGLWARLAVVALVTGEMGGGGGGSYSGFNNGQGGGHKWRAVAHLLNEPGWDQVQPYLGWIALGVFVALALFLLWIYSDCVYRFILLESVISGQCLLREGWRRWRDAGRRYLLWVLGFSFSTLVLIGILLGLPLLLAYRAGWFEKSEEHVGALIGGGILLVLLMIVVFVAIAVIDLLARDFLVPVMAFEDVGAIEGWQRLGSLLREDKLGYTAYVLMKVVLAMGSAIFFTILNLIVILILLIPITILGVAGYFIGRGAHFSWDVSAILLVAAAALLVIAAILFVMGFVYAPGLVFFQSYTIVFFASRYSPLANRIYTPATPVPIPAPPVAPATDLPPGDPFPLPPPDPSAA